MYRIAKEKLPALCAAIAAENDLFLPVKTAGKTNFALWTAECAPDLDTLKTVKSPKDVFFPQSENLYTCASDAGKLSVTPEKHRDTPFVVLGMRACDVRAVAVLDRVFLSDPVDSFYAARRKMGTIVSLACGTCTFVCPTCQCYDIKDFDTGSGVQRYRCWDSCMYSDFTMMAHGNNRTSQMQRFRQRFMHKLAYFPANNGGMFSCVGCGRCVDSCPSQLNIVKVIRAFEKEGM